MLKTGSPSVACLQHSCSMVGARWSYCRRIIFLLLQNRDSIVAKMQHSGRIVAELSHYCGRMVVLLLHYRAAESYDSAVKTDMCFLGKGESTHYLFSLYHNYKEVIIFVWGSAAKFVQSAGKTRIFSLYIVGA